MSGGWETDSRPSRSHVLLLPLGGPAMPAPGTCHMKSCPEPRKLEGAHSDTGPGDSGSRRAGRGGGGGGAHAVANSKHNADSCHGSSDPHGTFLPRGGGGLQPVLMRPPPSYLPKLAGGGGSAGGRSEGVLTARPRGGGGCARPTTTTCIPQGCLCVWEAWGYGGMYEIIAISLPGILCQEESPNGLKDQRHSTPLQLSMGQKIWRRWRHDPCTTMFQNSGGGGGAGGCRTQGPGPATPPGFLPQKGASSSLPLCSLAPAPVSPSQPFPLGGVWRLPVPLLLVVLFEVVPHLFDGVCVCGRGRKSLEGFIQEALGELGGGGGGSRCQGLRGLHSLTIQFHHLPISPSCQPLSTVSGAGAGAGAGRIG